MERVEPRWGEISRETKETCIVARVCLDGGERTIESPSGFFDHMLDALAKHGGLGLELRATGDTEIDLHHTVEDTGIALGQALDRAVGERAGMRRFASCYAPLDEALARAVIDFSGRGFFCFEIPEALEQSWVTTDFPLTLVPEFFRSLAVQGRLCLHLDVLRGSNPHHAAESCFKAVALALREAVALRPGDRAVPSTKGTLIA